MPNCVIEKHARRVRKRKELEKEKIDIRRLTVGFRTERHILSVHGILERQETKDPMIGHPVTFRQVCQTCKVERKELEKEKTDILCRSVDFRNKSLLPWFLKRDIFFMEKERKT